MSTAAAAHDFILAEVDGKCQFVVDSGKEVKSAQQARVRQLPCQVWDFIPNIISKGLEMLGKDHGLGKKAVMLKYRPDKGN